MKKIKTPPQPFLEAFFFNETSGESSVQQQKQIKSVTVYIKYFLKKQDTKNIPCKQYQLIVFKND